MTVTIRKVAWIHVVNRKLLCVRTGGRGLFYVPGGKPEDGEDDLNALIREIAEELGVALVPPTIRKAGRFTAPADGSPDKTVSIETYMSEFLGNLTPGFEISEARFLGSADADLASAATQEILKHLKAKNVID